MSGEPQIFGLHMLCNFKFNEQKEISLKNSFDEVFFGQACPITSFKPFYICGSRLHVSGEPQIFGFHVQVVILSLKTERNFFEY